ncbi:MAG: hypothetical protein KAW12_12555 [Candidatus Aminicenantes bacterium]|nr:hypothetical protein [Candidatus Aminicenantes bacterium]
MLLDNYDALLDEPWLDSKYDKEFFNILNAIKNNENTSILLTSCNPHISMPGTY